jgi:hypothetical protein
MEVEFFIDAIGRVFVDQEFALFMDSERQACLGSRSLIIASTL